LREVCPLSIRAILCLALIHTLVDTFSQVVTPLWPSLKDGFGLDPMAVTLLFAAWQIGTSVSQPFFGYWGDRFGSRWMLLLGPALAIVCISLVGVASGPVSLGMLLVVGGLGIGAFHPEAAVQVAEASGNRIAKGLAIFTCGGMLGLGIGPVVSGTLTGWFGLPSLIWLMAPGLVVLGLLGFYRPPVLHHAPVAKERIPWSEIVGGQKLAVLLLLTVATLRVVPVLGIPLGFAFLLHGQGKTDAEIGWVQSIFLLSGGLGTLICPLLTRPGRELAALVGTMLAAAGCLFLLTGDHPALRYAGLIGSGLLLQGAIPILLAYSQRLLPRGRRLASSLTLGASWGIGGIIVAGLQAYFFTADRLDGMIWAMVPFTVAAALSSCLLPRLTTPVEKMTITPSPIEVPVV
jgi:MFS transporter, FSR family, fosmidomycin resistance protein